MLKIGICDSNTAFITQFYQMLQDILMPLRDWDAQIFQNSGELLAAVLSGTFDCQLVFSELHTDTIDGIALARALHDHHLNTDLIFVTEDRSAVYESFQYHIFAYLLKPVDSSRLKQELSRYLEEQNISADYLSFSTKSSSHRIPLNSILYIESDRRRLTIHTKENTFAYYGTLNQLQAQTGSRFFRCHQSYLVAADQILSYDDNCLRLQDVSLPIPVSRRHQREVRNLLDSSHPAECGQTPDKGLRSLWQKRQQFGALVCTDGVYLGSVQWFRPGQRIWIGRDGKVCDIVINLPMVSRSHCEIIYNREKREYSVTDYSSNGTLLDHSHRLVPRQPYLLKAGAELCFGDPLTVYKLL